MNGAARCEFNPFGAFKNGLTRYPHLLQVDRQTIVTAVRRVKELSDVPLDAVVIGCSAFRVCVPGFISELEKDVALDVVTSTQCFFWNALRTGGVMDQIDGYGRLFRAC